MPPEKKAVDEFLGDLPSDSKTESIDELFQVKTPEAPVVPVKEEEQPHKNRRHRRLEEQLQQERELRIAAEARFEGRSEVEKFSRETQIGDVDPRWLRIYGDTPESRQAWAEQKAILEDYKTGAIKEAVAAIEQQREKSVQEEREYESFIDKQLEDLEDEYSVDLTSDSPAARKARREFLETVETLSPKDGDGNISEYADFGAAWDVYELKRNQAKPPTPVSRQKELADRSMTPSGGNAPVEQPKGPMNWTKAKQALDL